MIVSLTVILLCQLAGEIVARGTGWPIPGPVIGAALLFGCLMVRDRAPGAVPAAIADGTLETSGKGLLAHLSLLFVPAGVGVVQQIDTLAAHGIGLAMALVVSTVLAMVAAVAAFTAVSRWVDSKDAGQPGAAP